jgi:hypothetical protein
MADETTGEESCAEPNQARGPGEAKERRIRIRAYEIWEQEGRPEGRDVDHWLQAKWEIEQTIDPEALEKRLEAEFGSLNEPN